ncbi:MAG: MMPL family transporter [Deltaproteobacteria bacterium]|nr:MMPL family transporter [Deltaproteobacteria bacterium]MBW2420279.1 MMPL family transporter [Deltaproteobacteria bacterium]
MSSLILMLVAVGALISQLPRIEIDTSTEGFLHENDPALVTYNEFRAVFGRDEVIVVSVGPSDVFELGFLEKLRALHDELEEEVPHIDEITSLVNARSTRGEESELIVEDLLDEFPENAEELRALREYVLAHPIYRNLLISEDGRFTTVVIRTSAYSSAGETDPLEGGFEDEADLLATADAAERPFLTDAENSEAVAAVEAVLSRHRSEAFPLLAAGSPIITNSVKNSMKKDMQRFMAMAIGTIAIFLFVMFRRISGVLMPLFIVVLSLLSTLAVMAIVGTPIQIPTQILPSFLLAVGVGGSVHILAIFFRRLQLGDDKEEAIVWSMRHSGLPVLMTGLTTAAGLASFSTAEVAPIARLGIFASVGVMLGLIYTILLLPTLIALLPIRTHAGGAAERRSGWMDSLLIGVAHFSTTHARAIVATSLVVIAAAVAAASQLQFSHNPLTWLPPDSESRLATELVDRELRGSITVEVLLDTGRENGLYEPDFLHELDATNRATSEMQETTISVGKVVSIVDILKEIHQALNENDPAYYRIPDDRLLVAQELLLFENSGSDDLEDVTDSQFRTARVSVKVPWVDAIYYGDFLDLLSERYHEAFGGEFEITVTGLLPLLARTVHAAMLSTATSYVIAVLVITAMMIALVGNLRLGLVSMIPNLLPIVLVMGLMWLLALPLDLFTMMIGSIAIGLAVDDTVHFMHNFRRYHAETGQVREAVRETLFTTGRAMLVTTVVLSIGFFIFMFSSMSNLRNFGLLTGLAILVALLADYFLAPALMTLLVADTDRSEPTEPA